MPLPLAAFNHLLQQQAHLSAELATHAGRRIAISLPPLTVAGVITEAGYLAACAGEPEARVLLSHSAALKTLSGGQPALSDITLEGDAELAGSIARLMGRLRWDAVDDLSRLVGNVAAQRLENLARSALGFKGQVAWRLAENWAEHLREEVPLLASRPHVANFSQQVDTLRDDVARLEKRLAQLEAKLASKTKDSSH